MASSSNFRLAAKNVFLTFPQCPESITWVMSHLLQILNSYTVKYACVAEEKHKDDNSHFHAIVQLDKKLETRNPNFFDLPQEHSSGTYHPNVQKCSSPAAVRKYIQKEGHFIEHGEFNTRGRSPVASAEKIFGEILTLATDEESFLALVRERRPQDYVLRWPSITGFARDHYRRRSIPYVPRWTDFPGLPEPIQQWAKDNILFVSRQWADSVLCYRCHDDFWWEVGLTVPQQYMCNRSPSPSQTGPSASTSVDQPDPARRNGTDL
uniref:Replication-associated protein n=1 Tax=Mulberry mosaic dwarf associated virus TaxID=1631303 RepID=A0A0D5BTU6_9GEMI|nr:RepA protein [Mulberry mosaic dwarf associated virus]